MEDSLAAPVFLESQNREEAFVEKNRHYLILLKIIELVKNQCKILGMMNKATLMPKVASTRNLRIITYINRGDQPKANHVKPKRRKN